MTMTTPLDKRQGTITTKTSSNCLKYLFNIIISCFAILSITYSSYFYFSSPSVSDKSNHGKIISRNSFVSQYRKEDGDDEKIGSKNGEDKVYDDGVVMKSDQKDSDKFDQKEVELLQASCEPLPSHKRYAKKEFQSFSNLLELLPPTEWRDEKCVEKIRDDVGVEGSWNLYDEMLCRHRFIFVSGMHYSGTSLTNYLLQVCCCMLCVGDI